MGRICLYMSVTTSLCTVLCCCNLTRKGTKVSMKIKYCTAQRVCETLRARVCVVCTKWKGDGDGAVRVLTRWGPLSCGLFECGGCWGAVFRWLRIRPFAALRAHSCCLCRCGSASILFPGRCIRSGHLRLRPMAARAAMPILHCARDRVTCAARARQRGTSGFGWRAAVGRECGIAAWDRARCGASAVERGLSGSVGTLRGAARLL